VFLLLWVLVVLWVLTPSCALLSLPLLCSVFPRLPLAVGCAVLPLLGVPLRLFRGAPPVRACLWRFLWVRVLRVWRFLRPFVVVVRVRGVLLLWLLAWVVLCLWCRLRVFPLLGLVLWLLAFAVWVLRPAVACC